METDEVFQAWTSGDLEKMLQATENKTNLIDRHYLLLGIVTQTYKKRKEPGYGDLCERYARIHMQEFGEIKPALIKELDGMMPSVPTFQNLAILLTEQERFEEAIAVCNSAISHGVHDGTKSGFEGRITRVRKKMAEKK
ncbi:MAG: hypothetical protein KDA65_10190 [Planctomycetaceae bacterium]|nr:hypothetical protein [Planctomycetaceae bacterium]